MTTVSLSTLAVVLYVLFVGSAVGEQTMPNCPDFQPMANFDPSKYTGKWHVIKYAAHTISMPHVRCMFRNLTYKDAKTAEIHTEAVDSHTHTTVTSDGILLLNKDNPAISQLQNATEQHTVLQTDYKDYAVLSHCITVNGIPGYILMVTSKEESLSVKTEVQVQEFIEKNDLTGSWKHMLQHGCETL